MATYLMFGKYSTESLKAVSAKRTDKASELIKKHGGKLKAGYALLGDVDLVLVVELAGNDQALKESVGGAGQAARYLLQHPAGSESRQFR
jgi:uncharacterized protein with GYD domain